MSTIAFAVADGSIIRLREYSSKEAIRAAVGGGSHRYANYPLSLPVTESWPAFGKLREMSTLIPGALRTPMIMIDGERS